MLLHNIPEDGGEELVRSTILKAFRDTETQFFAKIDDAVIRRQTLMEELSVSDPMSVLCVVFHQGGKI